MDFCPQIYVRGSIEAVEFYKRAFNGSLGFHEYFQDGMPEDGYAHADIKVGDRTILALCENECYTSSVVGHPVMQFNLSGLGTKEAVLQAYRVLSEGAVENSENPNGPAALSWSEYCFSIIDKYNIWWWIAI
jgi:PhnB protein